MSEELKPCWSCGSGTHQIMLFEPGKGGIPESYKIHCTKCESCGAYVKTQEDAIAAWNTRAATEREKVLERAVRILVKKDVIKFHGMMPYTCEKKNEELIDAWVERIMEAAKKDRG